MIGGEDTLVDSRSYADGTQFVAPEIPQEQWIFRWIHACLKGVPMLGQDTPMIFESSQLHIL